MDATVEWKEIFSLLRSFVDVGVKAKFCATCNNTATQEALSPLPSIPSYQHYKIVLKHIII
jgi:hypothetical protein